MRVFSAAWAGDIHLAQIGGFDTRGEANVMALESNISVHLILMPLFPSCYIT